MLLFKAEFKKTVVGVGGCTLINSSSGLQIMAHGVNLAYFFLNKVLLEYIHSRVFTFVAIFTPLVELNSCDYMTI